jgi:hypothetical protein
VGTLRDTLFFQTAVVNLDQSSRYARQTIRTPKKTIWDAMKVFLGSEFIQISSAVFTFHFFGFLVFFGLGFLP